jgi:hypothetical protein
VKLLAVKVKMDALKKKFNKKELKAKWKKSMVEFNKKVWQVF